MLQCWGQKVKGQGHNMTKGSAGGCIQRSVLAVCRILSYLFISQFVYVCLYLSLVAHVSSA